MNSRLASALVLAFSLIIPAVTAEAARHAIVLLDRTGSMMRVRSTTGNSRCKDAKFTAIQDVQDFFAASPPGSNLSVWIFNGSTAQALTGFGNQAAAIAALNTLQDDGCDDLTPLADAGCSAIDALRNTFPGAVFPDLILAVSSDGGENNSTGECSGPPSFILAPPYADASWHWKVLQKLLFIGGPPVIWDVRYWNAFEADRPSFAHSVDRVATTTCRRCRG